jgi:hypothetical protein
MLCGSITGDEIELDFPTISKLGLLRTARFAGAATLAWSNSSSSIKPRYPATLLNALAMVQD